jgi:hypothetical protein
MIVGANGSLSRLFQKHLVDIPVEHTSLELQKTAILDIADILTYNFINFKCIFQKLFCNDPQGRGLSLDHGQIPWCGNNNNNNNNNAILYLNVLTQQLQEAITKSA